MPKRSNIIRCRAVYEAFAKKLLKDNPTYVSKRDPNSDPRAIVKHFWIYEQKGAHLVEIINFTRWLKILDTYTGFLQKFIIDGYSFNMGSGLGLIKGANIERNHSRKMVNWKTTWAATRAVPDKFTEDGKRIYVVKHCTDDEYVRIKWIKIHRLVNETLYEFKPSGGRKGFRTAFSGANDKNPLLKKRYEYFPFVTPVEHES